MNTSTDKKIPPTPWGMLPPTMRMLFVSNDAGMARWLQDSFAVDRACEVEIVDAVNPVLAIEHAKEAFFDAILVANDASYTLNWIEAIRTGTTPWQPIMVVGSDSARENSALCYEAGADGFLAIDTMTIRELLWHLSRASERRRLLDENQQLKTREGIREELDHNEVVKMIAEQRAIIGLHPQDDVSNLDTDWLDVETSGLLTNFFVMGPEHLPDELKRFADLVRKQGYESAEVVGSLLRVLDHRIREIGAPNSSQLYLRGNVLLLELLTKFDHVTHENDVPVVAPDASEESSGPMENAA